MSYSSKNWVRNSTKLVDEQQLYQDNLRIKKEILRSEFEKLEEESRIESFGLINSNELKVKSYLNNIKYIFLKV